ncbi:MAG TPA: Rieske 2Fe-2S domain-containing protein [Candidatus Thermoplasmatota archaeon]|nr:Rieske 2Fe-2S domain-containing protein [Candidatus Thermoplasmatota archaeon]
MQGKVKATPGNSTTPVEIAHYGHASIYIRTPTVSLVADPWFSPTGAFLSTWFQYPDNTQLDLTRLRDVDYVFLSHEHQDHFDYRFLQTLSPKTKIVIPKYADSYLRDELAEHVPKNEVIVVGNRKKFQVSPDVAFTPVVQSVPIWDDCTLVFETPAGTVVDVNDMKINPDDLDWVKANFNIDYLFIQYSGANWHPHVYDYTHEKKVQIARHKIQNKFHNVRKVFESSGARWLVPCAGPPCFLDPEHFDLNFSDASIFPTVADFYDFAAREGFADRTLILLPGDSLDLTGADPTRANQVRLSHPAFTDKRRYLEEYQARRLDTIREELGSFEGPSESQLKAAKGYFEPLITMAPFFREKIPGALLIETTGRFPEKILVDFKKAEDQVSAWNGEPWYYRFTMDERLFHRILTKKLSWEELFLSLRFKAARRPDEYSEHLMVFLRFANIGSLKLFERYEKRKDSIQETFTLEHEGKTLEVQKYCPHAMGDLSVGQIQDGCVVCPLHGWAFSLTDGSCAQNGSKIRLREVPKQG